MSRWCGTGNHWVEEIGFRVIGTKPDYRFARDCISCEQAKKPPARPGSYVPPSIRHLTPTREFPGLDIDRIHYLRGAVRKKRRAA